MLGEAKTMRNRFLDDSLFGRLSEIATGRSPRRRSVDSRSGWVTAHWRSIRRPSSPGIPRGSSTPNLPFSSPLPAS
ncbi:MAG: hypothetical protein CME06_10530 [Gemmatimonadetes bacterium]|nr:hypothetical protein [Gemmatimonadota bacterium]